jgi:hypothetical protein
MEHNLGRNLVELFAASRIDRPLRTDSRRLARRRK